jgi:hypothetical protein
MSCRRLLHAPTQFPHTPAVRVAVAQQRAAVRRYQARGKAQGVAVVAREARVVHWRLLGHQAPKVGARVLLSPDGQLVGCQALGGPLDPPLKVHLCGGRGAAQQGSSGREVTAAGCW